MSQPLIFRLVSNSAARSCRERRVRTTCFADVQKRPSIFRGGAGIPKDIPGHGFARRKCKSGESGKETSYPPQYLTAPNSAIGIGHQVLASGSSPTPLKRALSRR